MRVSLQVKISEGIHGIVKLEKLKAKSELSMIQSSDRGFCIDLVKLKEKILNLFRNEVPFSHKDLNLSN